MPWAFLLNPRVIGALAALAALIGLVGGAYIHGVHVERAKWELAAAQARAEAEQNARIAEQRQAAETRKVSESYEAKIAEVHGNYGAWIDNLRVRLKTARPNGVPKAPGAAGGPNAAAPTSGAGPAGINRERVGEVAATIAQDLDACREQVFGLQNFINMERR